MAREVAAHPGKSAMEVLYAVTPFADAARTGLYGLRDVFKGDASLGAVVLATGVAAGTEAMLGGIAGKAIKRGGRILAAVEMRVAEKMMARLPAPVMADHHIFPQQFKSYFSTKGIDIDLHTVSVPHQITHLRGLHGKGNANMPGGWNQRWKIFIEATPDATSKDVYQFAGKLMDEYGINHIRLHGYKL